MTHTISWPFASCVWKLASLPQSDLSGQQLTAVPGPSVAAGRTGSAGTRTAHGPLEMWLEVAGRPWVLLSASSGRGVHSVVPRVLSLGGSRHHPSTAAWPAPAHTQARACTHGSNCGGEPTFTPGLAHLPHTLQTRLWASVLLMGGGQGLAAGRLERHLHREHLYSSEVTGRSGSPGQ